MQQERAAAVAIDRAALWGAQGVSLEGEGHELLALLNCPTSAKAIEPSVSAGTMPRRSAGTDAAIYSSSQGGMVSVTAASVHRARGPAGAAARTRGAAGGHPGEASSISNGSAASRARADGGGVGASGSVALPKEAAAALAALKRNFVAQTSKDMMMLLQAENEREHQRMEALAGAEPRLRPAVEERFVEERRDFAQRFAKATAAVDKLLQDAQLADRAAAAGAARGLSGLRAVIKQLETPGAVIGFFSRRGARKTPAEVAAEVALQEPDELAKFDASRSLVPPPKTAPSTRRLQPLAEAADGEARSDPEEEKDEMMATMLGELLNPGAPPPPELSTSDYVPPAPMVDEKTAAFGGEGRPRNADELERSLHLGDRDALLRSGLARREKRKGRGRGRGKRPPAHKKKAGGDSPSRSGRRPGTTPAPRGAAVLEYSLQNAVAVDMRVERDAAPRAAEERISEAAATRIQNVHRGNLGRARAARQVEVRKEMSDGAYAMRIQALARGYLARSAHWRAQGLPNRARMLKSARNDGALRVQCVYRGKRARDEVRDLREARDIANDEHYHGQRLAATKIQSTYRGRRGRKRVETLRQDAAATRVQTAARGRLAKRRVGEHRAARRIQAVQRGRHDRHRVAVLRSKRAAAALVGAVVTRVVAGADVLSGEVTEWDDGADGGRYTIRWDDGDIEHVSAAELDDIVRTTRNHEAEVSSAALVGRRVVKTYATGLYAGEVAEFLCSSATFRVTFFDGDEEMVSLEELRHIIKPPLGPEDGDVRSMLGMAVARIDGPSVEVGRVDAVLNQHGMRELPGESPEGRADTAIVTWESTGKEEEITGFAHIRALLTNPDYLDARWLVGKDCTRAFGFVGTAGTVSAFLRARGVYRVTFGDGAVEELSESRVLPLLVPEPDELQRRDNACRTIQKVARGRLGRKRFAVKQEEVRLDRAALLIERVARGYIARKRVAAKVGRRQRREKAIEVVGDAHKNRALWRSTSRDIVSMITDAHIEELRLQKHPPAAVKHVLAAVLFLILGDSPDAEKVTWGKARRIMRDPYFRHRLFDTTMESAPLKRRTVVLDMIAGGLVKQVTATGSPGGIMLAHWVAALGRERVSNTRKRLAARRFQSAATPKSAGHLGVSTKLEGLVQFSKDVTGVGLERNLSPKDREQLVAALNEEPPDRSVLSVFVTVLLLVNRPANLDNAKLLAQQPDLVDFLEGRKPWDTNRDTRRTVERVIHNSADYRALTVQPAPKTAVALLADWALRFVQSASTPRHDGGRRKAEIRAMSTRHAYGGAGAGSELSSDFSSVLLAPAAPPTV